MKTGPRYKKARRLGPNVFEKTQSQKFAFRSAKKESKKPRPSSDFGAQMLEKQKARVTYGVNETQFANYVKKAIAEKGTNTQIKLYQILESRFDNVLFRIGLTNSRQASRQMASHGHILLNGKKITIPSLQVSIGDMIRVREGSMKSPLFKDLLDKTKKQNLPNWISFDVNKQEWKIIGAPVFSPVEVSFDVAAILEFYTR